MATREQVERLRLKAWAYSILVKRPITEDDYATLPPDDLHAIEDVLLEILAEFRHPKETPC